MVLESELVISCWRLRDLDFVGELGDCFAAEGCVVDDEEEEATACATGLSNAESEAGLGCCRRLKRDDMMACFCRLLKLLRQ